MVLIFFNRNRPPPPLRFRHKPVVHFTDSQVVETVMKKGSPVQDLHDMVWAILNDFKSHGIRLCGLAASRRRQAGRADAASRCFGAEGAEAMAMDLDDWGLADMSLPLSLSPPLQWDLLANRGLHRADLWFSKLAQDGAAGTDAFAFDWGVLGRCWICPPPSMAIPALFRYFSARKDLRHLCEC